MKKSRSTVVCISCVLLVLLFLISCGDKNPMKPEEHELQGTWDAVSQTNYWGSISNPDSTETITFDPSLITQTWTFKSGGNIKIESTLFEENFLTFEGTWSTDGDRLTISITFLGETDQNTVTYKVDEDKLNLTRPPDPNDEEEDWDSSVLVFKKR